MNNDSLIPPSIPVSTSLMDIDKQKKQQKSRKQTIKTIAVLLIVFGIIYALVIPLMFSMDKIKKATGVDLAENADIYFKVMALVFIPLVIMQIMAGIGLFKKRSWARKTAIASAVYLLTITALSYLLFPVIFPGLPPQEIKVGDLALKLALPIGILATFTKQEYKDILKE